MIIGAVVIMIEDGIHSFEGEGVFNISNFGNIFSNLVFSFLFHHSLPGIAKPLKYKSEVKSSIRNAFAVAGATLMLVPITAMMAFGD